MMRTISIALVSCVLAPAALRCALAPPPAAPPPPKLLRYRFVPGAPEHLIVRQEITQKMRVGTTPLVITMTMLQIMDVSWTVRSAAPDGRAVVAQTIHRFQMKLQSPQGFAVDYDSAAGKEATGYAKLFAPLMEAMIGKPFIATLDSRGLVKDLKVPAGFVESMNYTASAGGAGAFFSEESMRQMMEILILPEEPVIVGSTWRHDIETAFPALGTMRYEGTYEYAGTERREGREFDKVLTRARLKLLPDENRTLPLAISGDESTGTILFDPAAGRLREAQTRTALKVTIAAGGQNVEQDITMNISVQPRPEDRPPAAKSPSGS